MSQIKKLTITFKSPVHRLCFPFRNVLRLQRVHTRCFFLICENGPEPTIDSPPHQPQLFTSLFTVISLPRRDNSSNRIVLWSLASNHDLLHMQSPSKSRDDGPVWYPTRRPPQHVFCAIIQDATAPMLTKQYFPLQACLESV